MGINITNQYLQEISSGVKFEITFSDYSIVTTNVLCEQKKIYVSNNKISIKHDDTNLIFNFFKDKITESEHLKHIPSFFEIKSVECYKNLFKNEPYLSCKIITNEAIDILLDSVANSLIIKLPLLYPEADETKIIISKPTEINII